MKLDYCAGKFTKLNSRFGYLSANVENLPGTDFVINPKTHKILGLGDNCCDTIRIRNVLHHIENLNLIAYELNRLLKKNGILIISEPKRENWFLNIILDLWWYRLKQFRIDIFISFKYRNFGYFLKRYGFSLIEIGYEKRNRIEIWER